MLVPQPTSNGYPTPSGGSPPARRPKPSPGYDWLGVIVRRKWILVFFLLLAAIIGYLTYLQQPKIYASKLKLMIWTQAPPSIVNGETIVKTVSLGKHSNLITSELVLAKAVNDGKLANLKTFAGGQPLSSLREMITVMPVEDAEDTLEIAANGGVPEELPLILTEVVTAYDQILSEDSAAVSESSMELVEKLQEKISDDKSNAEQRYFALVQKLSVAPDQETGQFINPFQSQVNELRGLKSAAELELQTTREQIASIEKLAKLNATDNIDELHVVALEAIRFLGSDIPSINESSATDPENKNSDDAEKLVSVLDRRIEVIQEKISDLNLKLQRLRSSVGAAHPTLSAAATDVRIFTSELSDLEAQRLRAMRLLAAETAAEITEVDDSPKALSAFEKEIINLYRTSLVRNAERLASSLESQAAQLVAAEEQFAGVRTEIDELNVLARDIDRKDLVIRDILDRLSEFSVVANNHTYTKVRIIDTPGNGYQVEPQLIKVMGVIVFLGGMLGFGLIALLDWTDLSFRNPEEIQEKLGLPVVTRVPQLARKGLKKTQNVGLVTVDKPRSPAAEAYRSCRTSMLFASSQQNARTFLVTSPSAGDGKTTTACNIALCFAQGGNRTVLLDADLRRPRCDVYLKEVASPGLYELSHDSADLDDIIRPCSQFPNLSFVSAGKSISNAPEFIESNKFADLIERLKSEFDIIIIDSPPIVPVADGLRLASFVDAVLLVIKIRKGVVLASQKAVESLRSLQVNVLGVVVNGVDRSSHYSDYGRYGYNGYGGYAYYANLYYGKQNSKYYEAEKEAQASKK